LDLHKIIIACAHTFQLLLQSLGVFKDIFHLKQSSTT
jgi:hypothetical protein